MNSYSTYEERPAASSQRDAAPPPAPRPKRNLAEAMATLQQEHQRSSKAEVYTRSLLWDQIPAETVRQFREIVRENEEIEARQRGQQQQRGDTYTFRYHDTYVRPTTYDTHDAHDTHDSYTYDSCAHDSYTLDSYTHDSYDRHTSDDTSQTYERRYVTTSGNLMTERQNTSWPDFNQHISDL
ncbi:hypothetical protein LTS09_017204 [Friedmanniomyces endolithicus]|nr:hypothetical protein LTS09_017204 [Friedmanniomyces endolithicus]